MTTNITLLALLVEHSLVHWYQQCGTVHRVPKCMSCHKAIVVITGRAHCFHDYIYIYIYIYIHIFTSSKQRLIPSIPDINITSKKT